MIAGIIAFDLKEKEQVIDEDENEEDKEPALTAAEMRKMLKLLEHGLEQSGCCNVTNFGATVKQVWEHIPSRTSNSEQISLNFCVSHFCVCIFTFIYIKDYIGWPYFQSDELGHLLKVGLLYLNRQVQQKNFFEGEQNKFV